MTAFLDFVFDKIPDGPDGPRLIEVENDQRASVNAGEWLRRDDGHVVLRVPNAAVAVLQAAQAVDAAQQLVDAAQAMNEPQRSPAISAAYHLRRKCIRSMQASLRALT